MNHFCAARLRPVKRTRTPVRELRPRDCEVPGQSRWPPVQLLLAALAPIHSGRIVTIYFPPVKATYSFPPKKLTGLSRVLRRLSSERDLGCYFFSLFFEDHFTRQISRAMAIIGACRHAGNFA